VLPLLRCPSVVELLAVVLLPVVVVECAVVVPVFVVAALVIALPDVAPDDEEELISAGVLVVPFVVEEVVVL